MKHGGGEIMFYARVVIAVVLFQLAPNSMADQSKGSHLKNSDFKIREALAAEPANGDSFLEFHPIANCDPWPIPTEPEGPSITLRGAWGDEEFDLIAWRYPCNQDENYVILTIDRINDSRPFVCSSQLTLIQGPVVNTDYKLTRDPAIGDQPFCEDVVVDMSLAITHGIYASQTINLQEEFTIDLDFLPNPVQFDMFPYDPTAYDLGGGRSPSLRNQMAVNGLFYDPATSGQGFDFNMHTYGLTIFFYGHTQSGERLWLISDTHEEAVQYEEAFEMTMYEVPEGTFGNPGPDQTSWGTLTVTMNDCDSGVAVLNGADGSTTIEFQRLVGLSGQTCSTSSN